MPFEDVPNFSGRLRLVLHSVRNLAVHESVEPLASGENVGMIHETAATGARPVPALSLRECRLVGFHVARERQKLTAPVNARTDAERGELPVSDGNGFSICHRHGGSFAASVLRSWTTRAGLPVRGLRITIRTHPSCAASSISEGKIAKRRNSWRTVSSPPCRSRTLSSLSSRSRHRVVA